jgi:hypothetical protein
MRRTIQLVLVFVTGFGEFALFITKLVLSVRVLSLLLVRLHPSLEIKVCDGHPYVCCSNECLMLLTLSRQCRSHNIGCPPFGVDGVQSSFRWHYRATQWL